MPFFPEVEKIRYEGPDSTNPLSFRHYNADEKVEGKAMRDHFRFAVCYWHTFRSPVSTWVLDNSRARYPPSRIGQAVSRSSSKE